MVETTMFLLWLIWEYLLPVFIGPKFLSKCASNEVHLSHVMIWNSTTVEDESRYDSTFLPWMVTKPTISLSFDYAIDCSNALKLVDDGSRILLPPVVIEMNLWCSSCNDSSFHKNGDQAPDSCSCSHFSFYYEAANLVVISAFIFYSKSMTSLPWW